MTRQHLKESGRGLLIRVPQRDGLTADAPGAVASVHTHPHPWEPGVSPAVVELTCDAQVGGRAGPVLSIPLVDGLRVVGPLVARCHRKDHQLILQRDGSVTEKGQRQSHSGDLSRKTNKSIGPKVKQRPQVFSR